MIRLLIVALVFPVLCFAKNNYGGGPGKDTTDVSYTGVKEMVLQCEPEIVLQMAEANTTYLYWAGNAIRVSNNYRIESNAHKDITMKAGFTIVLKPKTAILKGNHYLARIEPCETDGCLSAAECVIPRGISPNGDTYNQSFDLTGMCVAKLEVFNRYGIEVYSQENYTNEWYGQSGRGNLPDGTYFYMISLAGGEHITGWVYLQK